METDLDSLDYWKELLGPAFPRYHPPLTPGAKHELALAEKASRLLGHPLMPWQRFWFRIVTEINEDGTYRHQNVVTTVPRQSGKTHALHTLQLLRALKRPHERIYHTAQSHKDAREHALEFQEALSRKLPASKLKMNRSAGGTYTGFWNGSRIAPFTPSAEGLHGYTSALVCLDEIFSLSEEEGIYLLGAVLPTQQTLKHKQLFQFSTMGTTASVYLNNLISKGREGGTSLTYFEWSLAPEADAFDPENWTFHPALGHTTTVETIQTAADALSDSPGEFIRAYMNRLTIQVTSLFDVAKWDKCKAPLSIPRRSRVAVAWEVSSDQSRAAIVGAWRDEDGTVNLKVLRNGFGIDWLPYALLKLREGKPLAVGCDNVAQNVFLLPELERKKRTFEPVTLTPAGIKTGSTSFKILLEQERLRHDGHTSLRNAVAGAQSRPMGEGWSISHKSAPEVVAAVSALRLLDEVKPSSKPVSVFA